MLISGSRSEACNRAKLDFLCRLDYFFRYSLFDNAKLGICENESKNLVFFHILFIMEYGFY